MHLELDHLIAITNIVIVLDILRHVIGFAAGLVPKAKALTDFSHILDKL